MTGAVVCGFWDAEGGLAGLGWRTSASSGGLLLHDGLTRPADAEIEAGEGRATLRLESTEGPSFEAELKATAPPRALALDREGGEAAGAPQAAPCTARVRGERLSARGAGHLTRWEGDPAGGSGVLRHLAIPAADGTLLLVLALGQPGASPAEERSSGWTLEQRGAAGSYPEALLSTQYDAGGRVTRVGVELWSAEEDAPPMRAAGTAAGEPAATRDGLAAAILRTSAEGHEGLGTYLVRRG